MYVVQVLLDALGTQATRPAETIVVPVSVSIDHGAKEMVTKGSQTTEDLIQTQDQDQIVASLPVRAVRAPPTLSTMCCGTFIAPSEMRPRATTSKAFSTATTAATTTAATMTMAMANSGARVVDEREAGGRDGSGEGIARSRSTDLHTVSHAHVQTDPLILPILVPTTATLAATTRASTTGTGTDTTTTNTNTNTNTNVSAGLTTAHGTSVEGSIAVAPDKLAGREEGLIDLEPEGDQDIVSEKKKKKKKKVDMLVALGASSRDDDDVLARRTKERDVIAEELSHERAALADVQEECRQLTAT